MVPCLTWLLNHTEPPSDTEGQSQRVQSQLEDLVQQVNSLQSELYSVHSELQRVQSTVQSQKVHPEPRPTSEPSTEPDHKTVNQAEQERVNQLPEQHAEHTYRPQGTVNRAAEGSVNGQGKVNQRSEPCKGTQGQQFIRAEIAQGRTPTLDDIMETCQCSRNTAIRYRRTIVGETGQERHTSQLRIVQS